MKYKAPEYQEKKYALMKANLPATEDKLLHLTLLVESISKSLTLATEDLTSCYGYTESDLAKLQTDRIIAAMIVNNFDSTIKVCEMLLTGALMTPKKKIEEKDTVTYRGEVIDKSDIFSKVITKDGEKIAEIKIDVQARKRGQTIGDQIVDLLKQKPYMTSDDISQILGVEKKTVSNHVTNHNRKSSIKIHSDGKRKGAHYSV